MNPLRNGLHETHWIAIDVACTVLLAGVYGVEFNQPADLTGVPRGVAALVVAVAVLPAAALAADRARADGGGRCRARGAELFPRSAASGGLCHVPDPAAVRPAGSPVAAGRLAARNGGWEYHVL